MPCLVVVVILPPLPPLPPPPLPRDCDGEDDDDLPPNLSLA